MRSASKGAKRKLILCGPVVLQTEMTQTQIGQRPRQALIIGVSELPCEKLQPGLLPLRPNTENQP